MPQSSKKFKWFFFQVLWQSQKISTLLRCLLRLTFHSSFTSDLLLIRVCFGQKLIVCVVGKFSRLLPWLYSTNLFECFTFPDSLTTLYSQFILSLPPKQFLSQTKNKLAIIWYITDEVIAIVIVKEFGKNNRGHLLLQTGEFFIYQHTGCPQNFSRISKGDSDQLCFKESTSQYSKFSI